MPRRPTQLNGGQAPPETFELARQLETARAESLRLAEENAQLTRRIAELEAMGAAVRESRRAALNVMEDAVQSNRLAESLNAELKREIAERERAEAAVRASEDRLRTLADAVPQIIWANEADGRATYFNRRWHDYSGLAYEQSAGPGWQAIVHPDDAPSSREKWQAALRRGVIFDSEYRLRRADGVYRWFIGRNVPLRNEAGQVTGWFGSATDIQDLKEAQAAAHDREKQFRRAIENAPIPVIMHTQDGEVLEVSRTWTELTGFKPEEIPTFDEWLTHAHGSGADEVRERMTDVFAGDEASGEMEFEIVTRDGERRHWLFSASVPGSLADGRRYAVGMAVDMTERKRAEDALVASQERLRLIVDGAVEHAIISLDLQRRVTSWNTGAERILGYLRDEIVGRSGDVIFTPEDRDAGVPQREAQDALDQGRAGDERCQVRQGGSRFWASGVTLPLYERPGGSASGFIKILRDETEKREAQESLEASRQELLVALRETDRARAEAEAATRAKDHFLAVLSHELRTPLMPVLMAASTLSRRKDLPDPLREALAMIRRNVQLEAQLVDDLLDVTRIVHGKMELMRVAMDMHDVVSRAAEITRSEIEAKQQQLTVLLQAQRHHLTGDPTRLQQVVWNLVKNASKFSPESSEIRVMTRNEGDRLIVEVTDQGIGIEAEALARIFDAFAQANAAITREFGGLGLGLSISKATVEAHGGTLCAMSPGRERGATFLFSLPLPSES